MLNNPIGIFDSGVGGLSVAREIQKILPDESIHYFADSGNCPYGSKSENDTISLTKKNIEFLLEQDCKLIVVACNTITTVTIDTLRKEYQVPFVGMEPALKPAFLYTKVKKIGVLATQNTFNGRHFRQTFQKYANGIEVYVQPGNGLVELVEEGDHNSQKAKALLETYLIPMMALGVDAIVLGCTHYPFLMDHIKEITRNDIKIIDPADAVAKQTKRIIGEFHIYANQADPPQFTFFTTGKKDAAQNLLQQTIKIPYYINHPDSEISQA
jgi:glutamate racemase